MKIPKPHHSQAIGVVFLSAILTLFMASCQGKNDKTNKPNTENSTKKVEPPSVSIAYVDLDSLEKYYTYFKEQKASFEKRQNAIQSQLESSANRIQSKIEGFQKKAKSGMMTQAEAQSAQKQIIQMRKNLEQKKENLSNKLLDDQDAFNKSLKNQLDSFLTAYNKDKHYDYILTHMDGGSILIANPDYNITKDVIKGLNAAYAAKQDGTTDNKGKTEKDSTK